MPALPEPASLLAPLFDRAGAVVPNALAPLPEALAPGGAVGIALPLFALAIAVSPGPSNVVLLAVGSHAGMRRGLPLLVGMALGYALLWGASASGLRFAGAIDPGAMRLAQGIALALMGLLAFRLVTATNAHEDGNKDGRSAVGAGGGAFPPSRLPIPGGLAGGLLFQLVNPKAWVTALAAAALFCTPALDVPGHAATFGFVAFVAVVLGCGAWLWMGASLGDVLRFPVLRRAMNAALALMLAGSAVPLVLG